MHAESAPASAPFCAPPSTSLASIVVPDEPTDGPPPATRPFPDADRLRRFGEELDAVKAAVVRRMGKEDVTHVRRLNRLSRTLEVVGRLLILVSPEPITFVCGVLALWIHKQLQATEIGHTALHGAYDRLPGAGEFTSKRFRWDSPIDEESWRLAHNVRHHGNTNVAGRDPDVNFGPVRLTQQTPWSAKHRWQLLFALTTIFPFFAFVINLHVTGLSDALLAEGQPLGNLPDRSAPTVRGAWRAALRKYVPYYLYNFVLFPVLAGPFFLKVLLGNVLAEVIRDIYSACTIFCGHVGHDVASYSDGVRAHGRGEWYAMQAAATNNYEVWLPISVLCGAL